MTISFLKIISEQLFVDRKKVAQMILRLSKIKQSLSTLFLASRKSRAEAVVETLGGQPCSTKYGNDVG